VAEGNHKREDYDDYSHLSCDIASSPIPNARPKAITPVGSGAQAILSLLRGDEAPSYAMSINTLLTDHEARPGSPHSVSALRIQTNVPQSPPTFSFDVPINQDALFNEFARVDTIVSGTTILSPFNFGKGY
jgi:hypothetical protein